MKFHYAGNRKKFKDDIAATSAEARKLGIKAECKGNNFNAVLSWRHNKPQYAFLANLTNESDIIIDGKIELIGIKWKWYNYIFYVLACILIIPFIILAFVPGDMNAGAGGWIPFPFSSKKNREKRLYTYVVKVLKCKEVEEPNI